VSEPLPLVLGISGASGARLGLRALQLLAASPDVPALHLVVTARALLVARDEIDRNIRTGDDYVAAATLPKKVGAKVVRHAEEAVDAPLLGRSNPGMAVIRPRGHWAPSPTASRADSSSARPTYA
jgi:3-polyprenyl-4-hydroxybenzoate decarboxylase